MKGDSGIRTIVELQTSDFTVAEKRYSSGIFIGKHSHDALVMSFPLAGSFVESNSVSSYTCEKYGLSINPAGEGHANKFRFGTASCLVITSTTQAAARFVSVPLYLKDLSTMGFALRIYRELKEPDALTPLMTQGLILEMLAAARRLRVRRARDSRPRWLSSIRDYINDNLSEALDLKRLSDIAGVHQTTLCRLFKRQYDRSIGDYIRELRISRSILELEDNNKSLAEIAVAAGYYDQSHFTNAFKRHTGMTPSEFRRK